MRTIPELCKEALDVQNACNLCGVAQGFARAMIDLSPHCKTGTTERNNHPVARLWIDKMTSLAGIQSFGDKATDKTLSDAYDYCFQESKKLEEKI